MPATIPVYFCPEYYGEWERLCEIEDTAEAADALLAEALSDAPAGASARIERRDGAFYLGLAGPSD